MYIVPISSGGTQTIGNISDAANTMRINTNALPTGMGDSETQRTDLATPFEDILNSAIQNVKDTQAVAAQDTIDLAMGNVDNLHNVIINMEKADTAMQLLLTVRTKALDAYNEVMRMNI